jgi:hypothetical protein
MYGGPRLPLFLRRLCRIFLAAITPTAVPFLSAENGLSAAALRPAQPCSEPVEPNPHILTQMFQTGTIIGKDEN